MPRRYAVADVFTETMFEGNQVAVVLDAAGLSDGEMLAVAREFNFSETTFVLPPPDAASTAWVRIFTPSREIPFAGHPNLGTAYVLAREAERAGLPAPRKMVFEEQAGRVEIEMLTRDGSVVGAELGAPEAFSRRSSVRASEAAACLSLGPDDVRTASHEPVVISVGLPFLVAELASREALAKVSPDAAAFRRVLPLDGATAIYAYVRHGSDGADASGHSIHARMFTPRLTEDPATGSATAALAALLLDLDGGRSDTMRLSAKQGFDMGRPSLLMASAGRASDGTIHARVGGHCTEAMRGLMLWPA